MTTPPALGGSPPPGDEVDARVVGAAVEALPDVSLYGGSGAGTFLRGDWVPGVRVRPDRLEVHIAVRWPRPVTAAAEAVRAAVAPLAPGRVDVVVGDLEVDEPAVDDPAGAQSAPRGPAAPPPTVVKGTP